MLNMLDKAQFPSFSTFPAWRKRRCETWQMWKGSYSWNPFMYAGCWTGLEKLNKFQAAKCLLLAAPSKSWNSFLSLDATQPQLSHDGGKSRKARVFVDFQHLVLLVCRLLKITYCLSFWGKWRAGDFYWASKPKQGQPWWCLFKRKPTWFAVGYFERKCLGFSNIPYRFNLT